MTSAGKVTAIGRYPVKSMRGEHLDTVDVGFQGIPGDRLYAFVQEGVASPFPWLTAREYPGLLQCQPSWVMGGSGRPALHVALPDGTIVPAPGAALAEAVGRASGRAVRLHADHRGNHDIAYVSIILQSTVRALSAAAGVAPDARRFRMNLVVASDAPAFSEASWVGRVARIGDVRLAITEQAKRCQMVTLDPETGAGTPSVLKATAELNGAFAGVYASVITPGGVEAGQELVLE